MQVSKESVKFQGFPADVIADISEFIENKQKEFSIFIADGGTVEAQIAALQAAKSSLTSVDTVKSFFRAVFRGIKTFRKAGGKLTKNLVFLGWFLCLLPVIQSALAVAEILKLQENGTMITVFVFCSAAIVCFFLFHDWVYREQPGSEMSAEKDRLARTSNLVLLISRAKTLHEVLTVISEDLAVDREISAEINHSPYLFEYTPFLPWSLGISGILSDGNTLSLQCGFTGMVDMVLIKGKNRPVVVIDEKLRIEIGLNKKMYKKKKNTEKTRRLGALRKISIVHSEDTTTFNAELKRRQLTLSVTGMRRWAGLSERLTNARQILGSLSFLYSHFRPIKKPAKPAASSGAAMPSPAKTVHHPATHGPPANTAGTEDIPSRNNQTVIPKVPAPDALTIAGEAIKDGILTESEKKLIEEAIKRDGVTDSKEKALVERLKQLVRQGRIKYIKDE